MAWSSSSFSAPPSASRPELGGFGPVLDSVGEGLYNAPAFSAPPLRRRSGAQVAQLVEHVTENHGVGGSIPPLGTKKLSLLKLFAFLPKTVPLHESGALCGSVSQ